MDIYAGSGNDYHPSGCFSHETTIQNRGTETFDTLSDSIVVPAFRASNASAVYGKSSTNQIASLRLIATIKT